MRSVAIMHFFDVFVLFSRGHNVGKPYFRDFAYDWARIAGQRMKWGKTIRNDGQAKRSKIRHQTSDIPHNSGHNRQIGSRKRVDDYERGKSK